MLERPRSSSSRGSDVSRRDVSTLFVCGKKYCTGTRFVGNDALDDDMEVVTKELAETNAHVSKRLRRVIVY